MYYWHVEFRHHGQDFERNLWADSYDAVKVEIKLMFGTSVHFYKIERIINSQARETATTPKALIFTLFEIDP